MSLRDPNWSRILTILLVVLASFAVLYIALSVLLHFTQAILLFILGAIVAYVLTPFVNRLQVIVRQRFIAIALTYILALALLTGLGVLLFTPFVQQSKSLIDNLHTPSSNSLQTIAVVDKDAGKLSREVKLQSQMLSIGSASTLNTSRVHRTWKQIRILQGEVADLKKGVVFGSKHPARPSAGRQSRLPPNPPPQTKLPPSYAAAISGPVNRLAADYEQATSDVSNIDPALMTQSGLDAKQAAAQAHRIHGIMASTPILFLRSQSWLDEHGLSVDVHSKFGEVARQVSAQGTNVLDNAITIVSATANLLLNLTLIVIISVYFVSDGARLTRSAIGLVPIGYRDETRYFMSSLDRVLGGYIRGQLLLSLLAGVLGGGGAAVLGVPYPLLIGLTTFVLETIPVIGPMVALVPAVVISLFFNPLLTTALLILWFLVFQQIVTNVIGPRVLGTAVGIHPLEALAAVLIGFPVAGLLGAFLAVPVAGIVHVLVREAYAYFVLGKALPKEEVTEEEGAEQPVTVARAVGESPSTRTGTG